MPKYPIWRLEPLDLRLICDEESQSRELESGSPHEKVFERLSRDGAISTVAATVTVTVTAAASVSLDVAWVSDLIN
uniref:Uncharacterized protein n=1 Tax=Oryza glumipatula TaxID=40148 RepID=A0A0E0ALR5_9ORYZ